MREKAQRSRRPNLRPYATAHLARAYARMSKKERAEIEILERASVKASLKEILASDLLGDHVAELAGAVTHLTGGE
jgi:hypothetical protein